jgi:hypothetical protein
MNTPKQKLIKGFLHRHAIADDPDFTPEKVKELLLTHFDYIEEDGEGGGWFVPNEIFDVWTYCSDDVIDDVIHTFLKPE